ncbi:MAG: amidohydrolase family protein [Gemmatimonadales bacterium]
MTIRDGRITAVGSTSEVGIEPGASRVSGAGLFLIPGLWDMHVHLSPMLDGPEILPVFLAYGVTGVRDAGSEDSVFVWQREVASGDRIGPRIVAAGGMLVSYTTREAVGPRAGVTPVASDQEAKAAVRALEGRAQYLKLQDSFLPRNMWLAAAAEADRLGLTLASHVPVDLPLDEAIAAGLRCVEHAIGLGIALAPDEAELRQRVMSRARPVGAERANVLEGYEALFEVASEAWDRLPDSAWIAADLMARHGVALDPTLTDLRSVARGTAGRQSFDDPRLAEIPPATRASWERQLRGALFSPSNADAVANLASRLPRLVAELHRRGVTILAGTDAGSPFDFPGSDIHSELALLVEAGLTPLDALRAATVNPAELMGLADSLGAVQAGMLADLVLLEANPLDDIRNSARVVGVVRGGRYHSRVALDSLLTSARSRFR